MGEIRCDMYRRCTNVECSSTKPPSAEESLGSHRFASAYFRDDSPLWPSTGVCREFMTALASALRNVSDLLCHRGADWNTFSNKTLLQTLTSRLSNPPRLSIPSTQSMFSLTVTITQSRAKSQIFTESAIRISSSKFKEGRYHGSYSLFFGFQ